MPWGIPGVMPLVMPCSVFNHIAVMNYQGQSFTAICHRRRIVRFNGDPWLGVGFYVSGALTKYMPKGNHTIVPLLELGKETFHDMVRQNLNWIMPYGLDSLLGEDRAEIVTFLDTVML